VFVGATCCQTIVLSIWLWRVFQKLAMEDALVFVEAVSVVHSFVARLVFGCCLEIEYVFVLNMSAILSIETQYLIDRASHHK